MNCDPSPAKPGTYQLVMADKVITALPLLYLTVGSENINHGFASPNPPTPLLVDGKSFNKLQAFV